MLKNSFGSGEFEAGCDEAGRGCLAGPVFAAAVVLPPDYQNNDLDDSKKLSLKKRSELRKVIQRDAIDWKVAWVDNKEIDKINILNASIVAMHRALDKLQIRPGVLLIDGNRFHSYQDIPHHCIIKGDGIYMSVAAASILAKTYRDDYMENLSLEFPNYAWNRNKGYPTEEHRKAVAQHGITPYHRLSFSMQLSLL
ncbi:MAG: ribonuclease HII [Bacteroidetes bacterium]|nr:ribonuclease HII [Bacteroidota bacterium]